MRVLGFITNETMMETEKISKESDRKREETIDKTSRCITKSSKPETNDPFNLVPEDLKVEILMKLAAKSIAKLSLVSESWLPIIYGKTFTKMYMNRSLTQPRFLFIVHHHTQKQSQKKPYDFSQSVHGLISCINGDNDVKIGNPTTGQFVTLLTHKASEGSIFSFLGYDNDVYKVLCLKVMLSLDVLSVEYQVLTLGVTNKWRTIECKYPHYPTPGTKGICINGVVYYLARVEKHRSLICFDLTNEDFSVIKLKKSGQFIANYNGKVALSNVLHQGKLDLWILEDVKKQEWSKVSILDRSWGYLSRVSCHHQIKFRGTIRTGELIFSPFFWCDWVYLLCYDPKKKKFKEVEVERVKDINRVASVEVFLDHIESPLFLSKVG